MGGGGQLHTSHGEPTAVVSNHSIMGTRKRSTSTSATAVGSVFSSAFSALFAVVPAFVLLRAEGKLGDMRDGIHLKKDSAGRVEFYLSVD